MTISTHKQRPLVFILLLLFALTALSGCQEKAAPHAADILSQKPTEPGRTQITVLVKYAFSINGFEQAVEKAFPDIDIVQVSNYSRGLGTAEYERRLAHDDLPDLVMTWPLDVGEEYWDDRLIDLSGFDFTSRYNLSMLNSISTGGKLHYLPGPAQVRGIVYNKTLFQERGWQVPTNYEEFLTLCQTIEDSGIRALQLGFQNREVLDTAFIGYNYADYFSKPQDNQWLADYNSGMGSFGDHFSGALDVFQEMIDAGIWREDDLLVDYTQRENLFFTRQCAMIEDSVLMARMGERRTGSSDEIALMPFFNPSDDGDWARLYMVCYIGLNQHLQDAGYKDKLELALKLMDYISTPQGQDALALDTGAMFSSLIGATAPNVPEIADLTSALNHGRYAVFTPLENAQEALRDGLTGLLKGTMTTEDVIALIDAQNTTPPVAVTPRVLGTATADFTMIETGNFVTDAMRAKTESDVALFLDNGKDGQYNNRGLSGRLYEGDITDNDVFCIMPDLVGGDSGALITVTMTGAELRNTLEYSISVENGLTGWFYYFSGLKLEFAPRAEQGQRIRSISLADGSPLVDDAQYTVAAMAGTVPEEYTNNSRTYGATITQVVEQAIGAAGIIAPSGDGRFTIVE